MIRRRNSLAAAALGAVLGLVPLAGLASGATSTDTSQTSPQCVAAKKLAYGKLSSPPDTQVFGSGTSNAGAPTTEQDKCFAAVLKDGKAPSANAGDYQCVGKTASVWMDSAGRGTIKAKADQYMPPDKCRTFVCDAQGKNCSAAASCSGSDSLQKCIASSPDVLKSLSANQIQQVTRDVGILDAQSQAAINSAFQQQINTAQVQIAQNNAAKDQLQSIINSCAQGTTNADCSSDNISALKAQQVQLDQQNAKLKEQMSALSSAQVSLKPTLPPTTPSPIITPPQNPRPPSTGFGSPTNNPLGNLYQPTPGNQIPQQPGSCAPQYTCSGTSLYSRDNMCVDRLVQSCQYGCQGNTCALQQQQQCMSTPAQPDPSSCTVGIWKPIYSANCVSNWQCVPDQGTGVPTAQISCAPQVADAGSTIAISYSCGSVAASVGSGFDTAGKLSGSATVPAALPSSGNVATYALTCITMGQTSGAECSVQVGKPSIVLVANPAKIASGESATIGWVTSGMQSCVISSPELSDFSSQNAGNPSVNGALATPALSAPARFLLHCTTLGGGTRDVVTHVAIQGMTDPF